MNERFHRSFVFPLILRLRGEFGMYEALDRLRSREYEPVPARLDRQATRLADILRYAARHCRFYSDYELHEDAVATDPWALLRSLPLLRKEDLQERRWELAARPAPSTVHAQTTGGSTGQPVTVLKDADTIAAERAASWFAYGWHGVRIGDRGARLWGSPLEAGRRKLRFDLADLGMNRIRLSAFGVTDDALGEYWRRLERFQPRYLYGYVSMLEVLARFLRHRGINGNLPGLKSVITTSEMLTPPQGELLEGVFGVPVQDEYGCGEVGAVAYECGAGSLHIVSDRLWVELLDDHGREVAIGEEGTVTVTHLSNRAMPLIRYSLQDRAVRGGPCDCARTSPVLGSIRGRSYDFVRSTDGRVFHGEFFMYIMEDLRTAGFPIERFRVIQTAPDLLEVQVQVREQHRVPIERKIKSSVEDQVGLTVHVECLERLPISDSGKLRIIENRV